MSNSNRNSTNSVARAIQERQAAARQRPPPTVTSMSSTSASDGNAQGHEGWSMSRSPGAL